MANLKNLAHIFQDNNVIHDVHVTLVNVYSTALADLHFVQFEEN